MGINDGTLLRGTASFTAGAAKFGSAGLATGVYQAPTTADSFISSNGGTGGTLIGGTIEGWVKTTATSTRVAFGHDSWYWVGITAAGLPTAHYGPNGGEITLSGSVAINDGAWHHIALVLGASTRRLYVDGAQVATSSTGKLTGTATQNFCVGGFNNTTNGAATDWAGSGSGVVDEVRISSTERYTGTTYTLPTAAFPDDTNAVALYHLEADATDTHTTVTTTLAPNDANIAYSPYGWLTDSSSAKALNPGAYLRCLVTGNPAAITATFNVSNAASPASQIAYRVDGGPWTQANVAATVSLTLPTDRVWTKHLVEIVVKSATETANRWNSPQNTAVVFTGFSVLGGTSPATGAVTARKLNVLIYGDSIAEAVRSLMQTATSGNDTDRNDATVGWAYRLGVDLGAEVGVIGFGRQGITITGNGNVPNLQNSYNLLWSGQARTFTPAPDLILINQGTNDAGQSVTSATFQAGYIAVLNNLLAATPATTLIGVMVPFNAAYGLSVYQAVVAGCTTPSRVKVIDTTGWWASADSSDGTHPYGYTNIGTLAPLLALAARTLLARGSTWLKKGDGTLKLVNPVRL